MKKPKVITNTTIRGGSGKTLFSILLAKYLPGKKLIVDTDIQNSLSFWSGAEETEKNLFNAVISQNLHQNIQTTGENTDIIISDIKLLDIQNLEPNRLKFMKNLTGYDYIIIDTAPSYNGLIYNCFQISDLIILPCMLDLFSFKSISYTLKKIEAINNGAEKKIFINCYEKSKSKNSYLNQLLKTFKENPEISQYISNTIIPKSIFFKQLNDSTIDSIPENSRTKNLLATVREFIEEAA